VPAIKSIQHQDLPCLVAVAYSGWLFVPLVVVIQQQSQENIWMCKAVSKDAAAVLSLRPVTFLSVAFVAALRKGYTLEPSAALNNFKYNNNNNNNKYVAQVDIFNFGTKPS
jgi:hypothetical protein